MAVVARVLALWWMNACRIVYSVDDADLYPVRIRLRNPPGHASQRGALVERDQ